MVVRMSVEGGRRSGLVEKNLVAKK